MELFATLYWLQAAAEPRTPTAGMRVDVSSPPLVSHKSHAHLLATLRRLLAAASARILIAGMTFLFSLPPSDGHKLRQVLADRRDARVHLLQHAHQALLVLEHSMQRGCHVLVEQAALDLARLRNLLKLRLQHIALSAKSQVII